jgi:large subunit ribosomal protein L21
MYAVIRSGGKQYRVAPGDVIKVEKTPAENGKIQFTDVLAVSGEEGKIGRPTGNALVTGQVMEEGRADKILVFHFKRKKQYKKMQGHRQPFTQVRITEIAFDGQKFSAPDLPAKKQKSIVEKVAGTAGAIAGAASEVASQAKAKKPAAKKAAAKKSAAKPAAKKPAAKKASDKKKK